MLGEGLDAQVLATAWFNDAAHLTGIQEALRRTTDPHWSGCGSRQENGVGAY